MQQFSSSTQQTRSVVDTRNQMAPSNRANPNCANASNPYHQCTQACSQQKTSKQTKPLGNKKSYGRSVTDGELAKKRNEERRTYAGCPKASNPYHKCDDNCHKRSFDSGATPLKFESKKKLASKPEPPVLDNVPATKSGAIYLSDASESEKKEVEPDSSDHIHLDPHSGEIQPVQDVKPVSHKEKEQLNEEDKVASHEVIPITYVVDDTGDDAGESADSGFTGFPQSIGDSDHGETESHNIPVGRYHVKESFAPILRAILDKYGDIGASCHLESVVMRSYYIECVCFVVQELHSASIMHLSRPKVKELMDILKDVESAQLRVAWLRSILDEIAENIELFHENQDVQVAKSHSDREVESLREELESQLQTLAQKEQEVADIKTRIPEIRDRLSALELKSSELDESMLSVKSMLDNLHSKSLIDELYIL